MKTSVRLKGAGAWFHSSKGRGGHFEGAYAGSAPTVAYTTTAVGSGSAKLHVSHAACRGHLGMHSSVLEDAA